MVLDLHKKIFFSFLEKIFFPRDGRKKSHSKEITENDNDGIIIPSFFISVVVCVFVRFRSKRVVLDGMVLDLHQKKFFFENEREGKKTHPTEIFFGKGSHTSFDGNHRKNPTNENEEIIIPSFSFVGFFFVFVLRR